MFNSGIHIQPLWLRLFASHNHVNKIATTQAFVRDSQQRISIGWQVNTNDVGLLVDNMIDEARVLVRKAVVVLSPDVGGQQIVQ